MIACVPATARSERFSLDNHLSDGFGILAEMRTDRVVTLPVMENLGTQWRISTKVA